MRRRAILAWGVHFYTALSAPLGVWAVFAIFAGDFRTAWFLLFATIILDSTDGILARAVRVWEVLPGFDGRRLDDIVDYFTWVIVPAILLVQAELLPAWAAAAPLLASCYGFAQIQAKTEDDYFLGFPSYWSLIGFYLYVFDTPVWFNTALILFLAVMVFVPIRYPYPTKTPQLRTLTLALGALTGVAMLAVVATLPSPLRWLTWATLLYPAYYGLLTLGLWWRRRGALDSAASGRALDGTSVDNAP
ncbi:MAG: CDP-diacylglycerol O-phosphatidyltransferase [Chloroflexota bacterium]|nr:CDP-diacylglycerol O-phosphatidyltransferase [Chloroflexota bacterium]